METYGNPVIVLSNRVTCDSDLDCQIYFVNDRGLQQVEYTGDFETVSGKDILESVSIGEILAFWLHNRTRD